jgi:hypothetical protein
MKREENEEVRKCTKNGRKDRKRKRVVQEGNDELCTVHAVKVHIGGVKDDNICRGRIGRVEGKRRKEEDDR